MGRFFLDSLLPATEELGRNKTIDLRAVAVFGVDDSEGGRYAVYFSPGAFSEFATLALAHGARPCDRPATESAFLLYGDERSARKLLTARLHGLASNHARGDTSSSFRTLPARLRVRFRRSRGGTLRAG